MIDLLGALLPLAYIAGGPLARTLRRDPLTIRRTRRPSRSVYPIETAPRRRP